MPTNPRELRETFKLINKLGTGDPALQPKPPAPPSPAPAKPGEPRVINEVRPPAEPQIIRERKEPELIRELPLPEPEPERKPNDTAPLVLPPAPVAKPQPPKPNGAATIAPDARLLQIAKLFGSLSERDKDELLLIALMKARR